MRRTKAGLCSNPSREFVEDFDRHPIQQRGPCVVGRPSILMGVMGVMGELSNVGVR